MTVERDTKLQGLDRPERTYRLDETVEDFFDYPADVLAQFAKGSGETTDLAAHTDAYAKGEVMLHLHLFGRCGRIDGEEFCAVLQRCVLSDHYGRESGSGGGVIVVFDGQGAFARKGHEEHVRDDLVFVFSVELVDNPEMILVRGLAALPRLYALNDCPYVGVFDAVDLGESPSTLSLPEILGLIEEDWELGSSLWLPGVHVAEGDKPDDIVKSGPEIVDGVPEHQTPTDQVGLNIESEMKAMLGLLGVAIAGDRVGVLIPPEFQGCIDTIPQLFSPVESSADRVATLNTHG